MLITISNDFNKPADEARATVLMNAYNIIKFYPIYGSDITLNQYLITNYKMSLKDTCIQLLLNITFYKNPTGELILLFKDSYYDNLANIITYGTDQLRGSKILQTALKIEGGV